MAQLLQEGFEWRSRAISGPVEGLTPEQLKYRAEFEADCGRAKRRFEAVWDKVFGPVERPK